MIAGVWLAGLRPLRLLGISGQGWPAEKTGTFTEQKATLCDPPHPPGDNAWGPPMVAAGSQASGLSAPTLLDGAPLPFQAPQRPPCRLSPAGRRKSFASISTPFWKIQTYISRECQANASSLQLLAQSLPQDWLGATAAKLEGLTKHSVQIYVWIFENGVNVNTGTLTLFPENTQDFSFNQPQTGCQHTA